MTNINENFMKAVGKRIRELRKSQKLTQAQLSSILSERYNLNICDRSISRYETGIGLPETDNLIYLADFFNVTTDYILYGKELSDDNSFTWYDTFKRLNRLIYPFAVGFGKDSGDGKIYLELWDDETKVYYERLQSFGVSMNYCFEHKNGEPHIAVETLDKLFSDFQDDKKQIAPNQERMFKFLKNQGIEPEVFLIQRMVEIKEKRER